MREPNCRDLLLAIVGAIRLVGCEGKRVEQTQAPGCGPTITSTGKIERVLDAIKPTSCPGVILMCNYCEYRPDGSLAHPGSRLLGCRANQRVTCFCSPRGRAGVEAVRHGIDHDSNRATVS